ncbi:MAG: hypothetical protein ACTHK7_11955 [Aureliella sp.]
MVRWNDDSEFGNAAKNTSRDAAKQTSNEVLLAHQLCRTYAMGQYSHFKLSNEVREQAIDKLVQQCWHLWVPVARITLESLQ